MGGACVDEGRVAELAVTLRLLARYKVGSENKLDQDVVQRAPLIRVGILNYSLNTLFYLQKLSVQ